MKWISWIPKGFSAFLTRDKTRQGTNRAEIYPTGYILESWKFDMNLIMTVGRLIL